MSKIEEVRCAKCGTRLPITAATAYDVIKAHAKVCEGAWVGTKRNTNVGKTRGGS